MIQIATWSSTTTMTTIDSDVSKKIQEDLDALAVPAEFGDLDPTAGPELLATQLEEWRKRACGVLDDLRTRLATCKDGLTLDERARIVSTVAQFDGEGTWVQDESRESARGTPTSSALASPPSRISLPNAFAPATLLPLETADYVLPERILSHSIRPIFQKNPHPGVNVATGRRLARPVGGSAGALDFYEGQEWKQHPGMLNTLLWCVRHIEVNTPPPVHAEYDNILVCRALRMRGCGTWLYRQS